MKQSKIKIGVLGTANIAIKFVVPAILELNKEFEFVGIATRKINLNQSLKVPIIEGYDNLLNKDLEAIYIPLPNALHYEWIKKALQKKIHVLAEKSLGCSYEEVEELTALAKKNNLVLLENFQFQRHYQFSYLKQLISKGKIGEIRSIHSSFCRAPLEEDNIRYQKSLGGGALLDNGVYPIKISQLILGNDLEIVAANWRMDINKGVNLWGGGMLYQKKGSLFSQFTFGFDNFYQCKIEIIGSKGKVYTHRIFTATPDVKPVFFLETKVGEVKKIILQKDNHFKNMLLYFKSLISNTEKREKEYENNLNQARLTTAFVTMASRQN